MAGMGIAKTERTGPMAGLARFAGHWRIARRIDDRRTGTVAWFSGTAELVPDGADALAYSESGLMRLGAGGAFAAGRRYRWIAVPGGSIAVHFADGRFFHAFDPAAPAPQTVRHPCAPDLYDGLYDLGAWPRWRLTWEVRGPRKDYRSSSRFLPARPR